VRCHCRKSGHLIRVICEWLFIIIELSRVKFPLSAVELIPEVLAVSLLGCDVLWKVTLKESHFRALKVQLWTTMLESNLLCMRWVSSQML